MTEAELIDRINSTIKKNGNRTITGDELNFVLKAVIQLISDSGGVTNWGDIEGTITDQLDLIGALDAKQDSLGFTPENSANKGSANGYAPLNSSLQIESTYLPSYVDDVIEVANYAALPGTGVSGKIYVTLDTNLTYRWSGSAYVEISASLALGENSSTAYRGDRGKTAYDHSQATGNPHGTTATDVDALKRDGSNANSDVDLGAYALNANAIKVNGTGGNGHVSMKHQSSGATATASESVIYADSSGNPKWKNDGNAVQSVMLENSAITGATKTKITYDSKGLVTNGADLTSSDIFSILGWWQYNRISESSAITNTIIETIIENITIPANTYLSGGILRLYNLKIRKVGTIGATTAMKIYIGPNSNNLTGATLIATYSSLAANVVTIEMLRTFTCTTSAIVGFASTSSSAVDTGTGAVARSSNAIDWTVNQYIIITIQPASSLDSYTMIGASAKNF